MIQQNDNGFSYLKGADILGEITFVPWHRSSKSSLIIPTSALPPADKALPSNCSTHLPPTPAKTKSKLCRNAAMCKACSTAMRKNTAT